MVGRSMSIRENPNNGGDQYGVGVFAGYLSLQTIGKGAFSTVKLAKHMQTNALVAIKEIDMQSFDGPTRELICMEGEIMNSLHHPNIVELFQMIDTLDKMFIVMEYTSHGTLEDILKVKNLLPLEVATHLVAHICAGLDYMHSHQLAHRDIKPANIFIDDMNVAKLGDLGFSTRISEDSLLQTFCGSLRFAAPELLVTNETQGYSGPPVDMWATGVTLYQMIKGEFPYPVSSEEELRIAFENPKTFTINTDIEDEGMLQLVCGLLYHDSTKRTTAAEVLAHPCCQKIRLPGQFKPQIPIVDDEDLFSDLPVEKRLSQQAKQSLRGLGGTLADCCSKTQLCNPRNTWTGTYRILLHEATKELIERSASEPISLQGLPDHNTIHEVNVSVHPVRRRVTMKSLSRRRASESSAPHRTSKHKSTACCVM